MFSTSNSFQILLADDDQDEIDFFQEAVTRLNIPLGLKAVGDGQKVLDFLQSNTIRPDFIFLDLNMPRMNGLECLQQIRSEKDFCDIPVVIYSTSSNDIEIDEALENGANLYIIKTYSIPQLVNKLQVLFENNMNLFFQQVTREKFVI